MTDLKWFYCYVKIISTMVKKLQVKAFEFLADDRSCLVDWYSFWQLSPWSMESGTSGHFDINFAKLQWRIHGLLALDVVINKWGLELCSDRPIPTTEAQISRIYKDNKRWRGHPALVTNTVLFMVDTVMLVKGKVQVTVSVIPLLLQVQSELVMKPQRKVCSHYVYDILYRPKFNEIII